MTGGEREVVRLDLGRGQPMLNVLPVGIEGDTMTLVCPFPVLPVEVPVNVTMPGETDTGPIAAVIRRVGVELMGEAALPRFKLQIDLRATPEGKAIDAPVLVDDRQCELSFDGEDDREEPAVEVEADMVVAENEEDVPAVEVVAPSAAEREERAAGADGEDTIRDRLPKSPRPDASWSAGSTFGAESTAAAATKNPMLTWGDLGETDLDEDPPWAAEHDDHMVHASLDEPSRRRARWPLRAAIALTLIVSVLAVGYETREQIAPVVSPIVGEELTLAALGLTPAPEPAPVAQAPAPAEEPASPAPTPITEDGVVEPATGVGPVDGVGTLEPAEGVEGAEGEASAPDPSLETANDQLRVILPTRWPVTEARSYRLNEPTGIVVDVPGGMASERARWIDTNNERVRSVRVLEREDGVRFIIYLNDDSVPRYRVGYSRAGVTVDILGPDPRHVASK